jgi:hypothetical protein
MVERNQIYEAKDGRALRVLLVRQNGTVLLENTETGRQGNIPTETLEKGGKYRLLESVKK